MNFVNQNFSTTIEKKASAYPPVSDKNAPGKFPEAFLFI